MDNKAIVSGHIYHSGNEIDIELLTFIHDDDKGTGIFDDIEQALLDNIDIDESEDYWFIAVVKSKYERYFTYEGEEWDVDHEVIEVKEINDINHLTLMS